MIARLVGRLALKSTEALVVDVHGVGYRVMVSLNAFAALPEQGDEVELAIHTHLRENALELFGFVSPDERALFTALITVSGIGPRMALNILSGVPAAELRDALAAGDVGPPRRGARRRQAHRRAPGRRAAGPRAEARRRAAPADAAAGDATSRRFRRWSIWATVSLRRSVRCVP